MKSQFDVRNFVKKWGKISIQGLQEAAEKYWNSLAFWCCKLLLSDW